MKKCNYCGRQNDDEATTCRACGLADFEAKPDPVIKQCKKETDEAPPTPVANKKGAVITLKCRTPDEAYLVAEELERADIIAILPDEESLLLEYRKTGYVEVMISAKAYESADELRSVVEYRYCVVRRDQPLSYRAKLFASGLGVVIVPGLLIFTWLRASYKANGYERRAKDLKLWFLLGVISWVVVLGCCFLFV